MALTTLSLIVLLFMVLILIGVPIGVALGLSPAVYLIFMTDFNPNFVVQGFFSYMDNFVFIAAPLFVLGGRLAEDCGILERLFGLTAELTRPLPGGLGVGFMLTSILLGAMTGVSVAAAVALSVMILPTMKKYNYGEGFAAGMICAGGALAMLIPPSLPLIIYGSITETPVSELFLAGIVPGVTLGVLYSLYIMFVGWRKGERSQPFDGPALAKSAKRAIGAVMMPVVVLGCIYTGITTPTEAAGIMVAYAFIYGLILGKWDYLKKVPAALKETMRLTAMLWLLVGGAGVLSMVLTLEQVPSQLIESVLQTGIGPRTFLFILSLFFLVMGMFMDGVSLIVVTMPVVFPMVTSLNINPIFFGIVAVINLELAVITPPVGMNLYAVSSISALPISTVFRGSIPYLIMIAGFLVFSIFVPDFVLLLN